MTSLRILVPDGTTNYVKNPSFRYDTTGWTAAGSVISRVLDYARFNIASLKVVTTGAALGEGCFYRVSDLRNISEPITASVYVRGSGIVRVRLTTNNTYLSENIELLPTRWQRVEVSGYSNGGDDVRIYVETVFRIQAATFYVDGAQIERHAYATTYCDGDQEGCWWNVLSHGSISTRPVDTRTGGRWISLVGCDRAEPDLYFTVVGGLGVAPIRNDIQSYADAPGSYYQSTKVLDRVVTITFFTKHEKLRRTRDVTLQHLHRLRSMLWNILKPDKTSGGQEFLIEYQDGARPVYLWARYDGGLEGEWDVRNEYVMSFPLRLLAVSPFLFEDDQEVATLDFRYSLTANFILRRFDGNWSEMNGGLDDPPRSLAIGKRGEIVAGGAFVHANNKVTALDPMIFANRVCYWNGDKWVGYGTGANDAIFAVAVAPNGDIYVTGQFTSIGGVACNRVARWNSATSAWVAMGTGLDNTGFAIRVAPNGDVYVGGAFTAAGTSTAKYIARWDGSSWHRLGASGGLNNDVFAIAISDDGTQVFAGGEFTDEYGTPGILALNYVGLYYPATDDWWEVGDGFNNIVRCLDISPSGRLYAGGDFVEAGNLTGQVMLYIAYFNGAQWFDMNGGADNIVRCLDVSALGQVIAGGDFTRIGGVDANYCALWNGSVWVALDTNGGPVYACLFDDQGNIYLGSSFIADYASVTIVENIGSAEVSPKLYILGQGTLKWIENQTSRRRLYADLDILTGEEIMIDFAHGTAISTVRGNLSWGIQPGSDFRSWKLLPGRNEIAALMENNLASKMQLSYTPRHWSADATHDIESF